MSSTRLTRSLLLRDSILSNTSRDIPDNTSDGADYLFMHILDCIGALTCLLADQRRTSADVEENRVLRSKYRVFWQTVREIAEQEVQSSEEEDASVQNGTPIPNNVPLNRVLNCFPDESKRTDGRMWLPLHFAVSLPNISLVDIKTIFIAHPAAIKAFIDKNDTLNPYHLAVMMANPRLEIVQQLQIFHPLFGSSLANYSNTPLHLAAWYSNSVAMVRELAHFHPAALCAKNIEGSTPLHIAAKYSTSMAIVRELCRLHPAALEMTNSAGYTPLYIVTFYNDCPAVLGKLQVLLEAAPQAARIAKQTYRRLPLHQILIKGTPPAIAEMVALVLAAYRDAVNIPDINGWLPIHFAVMDSTPEVLKLIAEENMNHLSIVAPEFFCSLAHMAVLSNRLDNLRYIHSTVPEVLLTRNRDNKTPLHHLYLSLANDCSPLSVASEFLRFFVCHCPSLATAKDSNQQTLYDHLPAENAGLAYARRLLLLAGASSLYPGVLQEMNYAARREALLLFYSSATKLHVFFRIRNAAGGAELMRTIVCFL